MIELLIDRAASFLGAIRVADALDIVLVACLVYWLLMSFRRRAATAGIAISMLVVIYVVARRLDMFLTQWLFHVGLTVIVIAMLILFQEDVRRHLERLLDFRSWRRGSRFETSTIADQLIEALDQMAREHTGALIVLPGRDSLDRHVRGGIPLGGLVSVPMVLSLFDSNSPGHDGAVIIEADRITQFAAHLPLSRRIAATPGGTRHTAALGLAERCDAVVFVVSEERGVVSVAHEGTIRELSSTAEIGRQLETFLAKHGTRTKEPRWPSRLVNHLGTRMSALAIATVLWGIFVWNVEPVQRTLTVPVEFRNVPESWNVSDVVPSEVRVTLSGPANQFELLDREQLRFSMPMDKKREGQHSVWLRSDQLTTPAEIEVRSIEPQWVFFRVTARTPDSSAAASPESEAP